MFQTKVVLAALKLLEAPAGPVLEDFPEEAPALKHSDMGWACPVNLASETDGLTDKEALIQAFGQEMERIRSWYEIGVKRRRRTTYGVSGLGPDAIRDFVIGFLAGSVPVNPREGSPFGLVLKLAADDLKTYYFEAASAQPGESTPSSDELTDWFWQQTVAARVLRAVKDTCIDSGDRMLQAVGEKLLIPVKHWT
ncbi:MAG: hypothetical protein ACOYXY_07055 [Thermodesulfobacteriota bacterium]